MPKVLINGLGVHYQRHLVSGPDLVLVHGLAANLAFWYLRVLPLLSRDFCITVYDLRGHGQSEMPPSGYTTADMASDLHGLLDYLGVGRAHLVGHSYGGAVALHYTALHPDRVASLTLADARIRVLQPTQRLRDWPNADVWKRKLKELNASVSLDDPEMGYRFLEVLAEAKVQGKKWMSRFDGTFSPFGMSSKPSRTAERWLRLLRTTTARNDFCQTAGLTLEKIHRVHHPVLASFGEFSHCLPSCRGLKRHLPDCKVIIVPRAGHFHPVVRPAFFGRKVRKFLREVNSSRVNS
jgi:pimeloyl-ACP methyl ester carboxylesterase